MKSQVTEHEEMKSEIAVTIVLAFVLTAFFAVVGTFVVIAVNWQ